MKDDKFYGLVGWLAALGPVAIAVASWILWAVAG